MIEEVNGLSPDTLQAAHQQAGHWLADSQSLEVLSRLNVAAGKLAASIRRELSRDEAVDLLLTKPYDIDQKLLEYEHDLIKEALIRSDGKVSHAAKLVGKSYQGLAKMIATKHPDFNIGTDASTPPITAQKQREQTSLETNTSIDCNSA